MCGLTFELRRPARQDALAAKTMIVLGGFAARAACLAGSPLERGVRRHAAGWESTVKAELPALTCGDQTLRLERRGSQPERVARGAQYPRNWANSDRPAISQSGQDLEGSRLDTAANTSMAGQNGTRATQLDECASAILVTAPKTDTGTLIAAAQSAEREISCIGSA